MNYASAGSVCNRNPSALQTFMTVAKLGLPSGESAISLEDYSELETTAHLQRSPRNAARLRAARAEVEKEIARRTRCR